MGKGRHAKRHRKTHEVVPADATAVVGDDAASVSAADPLPPMRRRAFEAELRELEFELVQLQAWIQREGLKVVVLFEGRDTAGKGGVIKRITGRLSPRVVRVVALGTPTERERTQYYLQRYVPHLPAAGEMVLFDRSWYNRAGVERVMGFATEEQVEAFLELAPGFEQTLVMSGIVLIKYWLDIDQTAQEERFEERMQDPRRRWKLSPMDLEARRRWDDYTAARDEMLRRTSSEHAPWYVVDATDQRRARLAVIRHLLASIPHEDLLRKRPSLAKVKRGHAAPLPEGAHIVRVPLAPDQEA